jgi:hypothetical protein
VFPTPLFALLGVPFENLPYRHALVFSPRKQQGEKNLHFLNLLLGS